LPQARGDARIAACLHSRHCHDDFRKGATKERVRFWIVKDFEVENVGTSYSSMPVYLFGGLYDEAERRSGCTVPELQEQDSH
jgi:hypothetical protein